ncbi:hypothetical protein ABPG75_011771 [Micractinium tetrahymenae]
MRKQFAQAEGRPDHLPLLLSVHLSAAAAATAAAAAAAAAEAPAAALPDSSGGGGVLMWGATFAHDPLSSAPAISSVPVPVPTNGSLDASAVTQVAAGIYHACLLLKGGSVACLGSNAEGQLCLGAGSPRWTGAPLAVPGGPYKQVAAGTYFTCLLLADGSARCCGSNLHGELGDGGTQASAAAVDVAPGLKFEQISAGTTHVCGIEAATSKAWCWGDNASWQLGGGAQPNASASAQAGRLSAAPVAAAGSLSFVEVSAGAEVTCGRALAGGTYCWGNNEWGSLGNRTFEPVASAAPLLVAGGHSFAAVSCGHKHCCAIDAAFTAWCWGLNTYGALGTHATAGTASDSSQFFWDSAYNSAVPLEVRAANGGLLKFRHISAGFAYTCGVTTDGMGLCWGDNQKGEGGNAGSGIFAPPTPVFGSPRLLAIATSVSKPRTAASTYAILQPAASPSPVPPAPAPGPAAAGPTGATAAGASSAATPPPPLTGSKPSSSSSTAAAIGGAVGGLAAAALLAALAVVSGRRWLRRKRRRRAAHFQVADSKPLTPVAPAPDASLLSHPSLHPPASPRGLPGSYLTDVVVQGAGSGLPSAAACAPAGAAAPPASGGSAAADGASGTGQASPASTPHPASNASSGEDPVLSYIASYLARAPRQRPRPGTPASSPGASSSLGLEQQGSSRSASSGLSSGVQQWECGWEEISILQAAPLGRGSFGKVFLARRACVCWKQPRAAGRCRLAMPASQIAGRCKACTGGECGSQGADPAGSPRR